MAVSKQHIFFVNMPYPKKTNIMEIWSLQTQAIVLYMCVWCGVCVCLSLCLPSLLSKHLNTAAAKFILMQSGNL